MSDEGIRLADLAAYPCPWGENPHVTCVEHCYSADTMRRGCPVREIYRQLIALRKALLGDMTPEEAAQMYRTAGKRESGYVNSRGRFYALADIVKGIT